MIRRLTKGIRKKTISGTSKVLAAILPDKEADYIADEVLAKAQIKQIKHRVLGYDSHNMDVDLLAEKLLKFDVISFDVFDTLLLRNVSSPKSIFDIIGEIINFQNFRDVRVNAERNLRRECDKEVTIDQIYDVLGSKYGIDSQRTKQLEIQLEKELSTSNPYMLKVYEYIKQHKTNQILIMTSDMYLSYETVETLLEDAGYKGYDQLFLSSKEGYQKLNCTLFRHISELFTNKSIIHIGDNEIVDFVNAKKCVAYNFQGDMCLK